MAKGKEEKMTVEEAGKRGGQATSKKYGREFYEKIGHKGGPKGGQRVRNKEGKEAKEQYM
ncbi:MAG: hypothetical protein UT66_C0018G0024 [candidate division CPR2 bacterium GW2011_GWC1_39_9]|uniref:General stress protein B n=1 Tax=candidate division CPR2 bacterium GW2011_GWC2_39_10 TaxID=1618345 RepID=A0A0G0LPY2_UNCC2|nr:MAG: hypothetical protein UT18_C0013G0010 [candidate division CPR2 bacterium GW2011_GWC2_39_10]KKR34685.1 MAG: hypothetical protein UT66_C0018G0024 [candidate division CPR2 bacterium GW2011_GWC1_39_9]